MRFLTRIQLDGREAANERLVDGYAWHQALWQAFPGRDGEEREFLFRVDQDHGEFRILLLSPRAPQPLPWGVWTTKTIAPAFLDHTRYAFDLRANPTMRRNADRRRLGIYQEDRLREWFHHRAERAGIHVPPEELVVGAPVDEHFRKPGNGKGGMRGKHVRVDFRGLLQVTDPAAFREAFARGIGTARAFGFGMLTLQPLD
jgi:CRISPR system Cascade subunit CasE